MNQNTLYWFELTLLLPLTGACFLLFIKSQALAARWCMGFILTTLFCATFASFEFWVSPTHIRRLLNTFGMDDISAPMLPIVMILHLLTMLGTAKSRISSFYCLRIQLSAFLTLSTLTCHHPQVLVLLLLLGVLIPVWDLESNGRRLRGYLLYMCLFALLMIAGSKSTLGLSSDIAIGLMMLGLIVRGGIFPFHGWQTSLIQQASFGGSMLLILPLVEVVAVIRLVLPISPVWILNAASIACLITAVYCSGLAIVQQDVRRFYAYLCLSQTSLVLFAVMLATPNSITAALCLWISSILSLAGMGFAIGALEARFGKLSLSRYHGYYEQVPGLAICFFITGLATVGFPGTVGFVPMELLISGSIEQGLEFSLTLAIATMFNGLAVMRAYFALFTGKQPSTSVSLQVTPNERIGIIIIAILIFVGVGFSPSVVLSRHRVADELVQQRGENK